MIISKLNGFFKPPVEKEVFSEDLKQVNRKFNLLRNQILLVTIVTYILYYFTRKSFDLANAQALHNDYMSSMDVAILGMCFAITYGSSKFIVGNFADRSSGRVIMSVGLLGCAIVNFLMGGVINIGNGAHINIAPIILMCILMIALGIFQGMGWPAVARMFSNWFTDKERSKKIAIWNTGGAIGTSILPFIVTPLVFAIGVGGTLFYSMYYWVPSILALIMLPVTWWGLRDNPQAEALPSVEKWQGLIPNPKEQAELNWKEIFVKYILKNKFVWILAFANIWVYVIRQGMSTWMLNMADDEKGIKINGIGKWLWTVFEWAGLFGGILSAFCIKWWFQNRTAPIMIIGLSLCLIGVIMFQQAPKGNVAFIVVALFVAGFGIYIPKTLIGAAAIQLTNRKAAATASGFTGLFGYMGDAVFSKPVVAALAPNHEWNNVFYYFYACITMSIVALAFLWNKNENNKFI